MVHSADSFLFMFSISVPSTSKTSLTEQWKAISLLCFDSNSEHPNMGKLWVLLKRTHSSNNWCYCFISGWFFFLINIFSIVQGTLPHIEKIIQKTPFSWFENLTFVFKNIASYDTIKTEKILHSFHWLFGETIYSWSRHFRKNGYMWMDTSVWI